MPQPIDVGAQGVAASTLPVQLQPEVTQQAAADVMMAEVAVQPESSLPVLPDTVPPALPVSSAPSAAFAPLTAEAAQPATKGACLF